LSLEMPQIFKKKHENQIIKQKVPIGGYTRTDKLGNIQVIPPFSSTRKKKILNIVNSTKTKNDINIEPITKFDNASSSAEKELGNVDKLNSSKLLNLSDGEMNSGDYYFMKNKEELKNSVLTLDDNNLQPKEFARGTSGISYYKDEKDIGWFFKDKEKENYFSLIGNEKQYYRENIDDDMLGEREKLTYDFSREFGIDVVSPTKITKTDDGKTGSIQMDVHDFAKHFKDENGNNEEWDVFGKTYSADDKVLDKVFKDGNGMDIAVFSYITGNTDLHNQNSFILQNKKDNKYRMVLIDGGLSFPGNESFEINPDMDNTINGIFKHTTKNAKKIGISDNFKKSLSNQNLKSRLKEILNNSNLSDESKKSTLSRFHAVKYIFDETGNVSGENFKRLVLASSKKYADSYKNTMKKAANRLYSSEKERLDVYKKVRQTEYKGDPKNLELEANDHPNYNHFEYKRRQAWSANLKKLLD